MKVDVVLGLQWGDEGKGKIVDVLANSYPVIARFQGGPNAGHSLHFEGKIRTRSWTDQTGAKRYTTEIVADNIRLLDRKGTAPAVPVESPMATPMQQPAFTAPIEDASDDLPF